MLSYRPSGRARLAPAVASCASIAMALAPIAARAELLDFGAALQPLAAGTHVGTLTLDKGATMRVTCTNGGEGPDLCIVFDSAHPTGGDVDLGTPNEDFEGPGKGRGGERGKPGENAVALGKLLILAADDEDDDGDGLVDDPADERDGGVLRFDFSHAGRLSFRILDVDHDEAEPRVRLYKAGQLVAALKIGTLGDNSVRFVDLGAEGDIDSVEIELGDSAAIADVKLDVVMVPIERGDWTHVKRVFR